MSVFIVSEFAMTFFDVLIIIAKKTHVDVVVDLKLRQYIFVKYHVFFANDHIIKIQTFVVALNFEIRFSNSNALFNNLSRVCFSISSIEEIWLFFYFHQTRVQTWFHFFIFRRSNLRKIVREMNHQIRRHRRLLEEKIEKKRNTTRETRKSSYFLTKAYNNKFKRSKNVKSENVDWKNSSIVFWLYRTFSSSFRRDIIVSDIDDIVKESLKRWFCWICNWQ